jgi:hypothetical protein
MCAYHQQVSCFKLKRQGDDDQGCISTFDLQFKCRNLIVNTQSIIRPSSLPPRLPTKLFKHNLSIKARRQTLNCTLPYFFHLSITHYLSGVHPNFLKFTKIKWHYHTWKPLIYQKSIPFVSIPTCIIELLYIYPMKKFALISLPHATMHITG